jgi:hypothetical protein
MIDNQYFKTLPLLRGAALGSVVAGVLFAWHKRTHPSPLSRGEPTAQP